MTRRTQSLAHFLLGILAVGAVRAIVGDRTWTESTAATVQPQMPGADVQQLWKYISKDNPYKSWKIFPGLGRAQ